MMSYWFLFAACLLFAIGSFAVVRGSAGMALSLGLSQLSIGVIVAATAGASPELFVALRGVTAAPDLVAGGIIGGIILSLTLMLGLGALIAPLTVPPKVVFRDGGALILAALAFLLFARDGMLSRLEGAGLLVLYIVYLVLAFYTDWRRSSAHSVARERAELLARSQLGFAGGLFVTLLGLVAVMLGAYFVLAGGTALARMLNLPDYAVGLSAVALAVSLPELFVILAEALRRRSTVAVGQTFGAAFFGLTLVFGLTAQVRPLAIAPALAETDSLLMFAVCVVLPFLAVMRWRLSRTRGVLLVAAYGTYLGFVAARLGFLSIPLPQF